MRNKFRIWTKMRNAKRETFRAKKCENAKDAKREIAKWAQPWYLAQIRS